MSGHAAGRGLGPHAAFLLHQATERYFHATTLVYTGYKSKTHNIEALAKETAALHPALVEAIPRAEKEDERLFDLLKRAYIEARYNKSFKITLEELRILRERVHDLAERVRLACTEKLASFCGPEAVGELPEVPSVADMGELPEAPSFDDASAFRAWREALTALTFDRGQQQGFDRGLVEGEQKGQKQALFTILATRGIAVDAQTRANIEACSDPGVLNRWIARAMAVESAVELFASESEAAERS